MQLDQSAWQAAVAVLGCREVTEHAAKTACFARARTSLDKSLIRALGPSHNLSGRAFGRRLALVLRFKTNFLADLSLC